jgi:tetratricopeptide (TPR) repeat protein
MNSIRRLCFPQAGLASAALATIYLGLVPMIPIVLQRPDVWEVPITASYAFWMLSLLVLWAYLNGPPQAWGAALCLSACVGLAVGCRPNTLLGASILVVPLYRMARSAAGVQGSRLSAAMAALILPIAAIGACLAAYNYCRFGDAMEFGQKYQLNGELATSPEFFRARFIGYNFRIYFLHYQDWGGTFPFVRDAAVPNPPVGHAGVSGAVGVLTLLPFTIFAAAAPLGFQEADTRHVQPLKVIVGAVALLFASILGPLLLFFGAVDRYEMEFAPAMVLLAVIGQFALESRFAYSAPRSFGVKAALYLCAAGSIAFNLLTATSRRAGTLSFRGNLAMDRGQWEEAGDLYRQSLRLAPGQLGTRVNLGLSYVREGDLADACAAFGVAAQEFPDSADARLKHGWSLFKLGRLEEAEAECRVALQEDPRSAIAREALRQIEEARAAGRGPAGHIP